MNNLSEKISLLLVDDEEDFLLATSRALERRGIEVSTASGGEEALRMIRQHCFDVAVLDVKMPGMDGLELFRQLRKERPSMPVLILTGHGSVPQAFETSREGLYEYLAKPCDIDALVDKIREAAKIRASELAVKDSGKEIDSGVEIRVLLVDDEVEFLESFSGVLRRRKMKVFTAQSGEEAFNILKDNIIDVAILDVKMPGMDGIEVLQHIKRNYPGLEVILLTGHPNVGNALEGVKLGAFEYLVKPPDINDLTESIHKAFRHRQERLDRQRQDTIDNILKRYPE